MKPTKYAVIALAALLVVSLVVCGGLVLPAAAAGTTYYVDCSAPTNGNGSQSSPWNNVATPSGITFQPGDSILLKRGVTCSGMLWPKGSGTAAEPITIGAYGTGALPIVDGGTGNNAAIKIYQQSGWHIENVETTGGNLYGIYIGNGGSGVYSHFRVTNVVVHDVFGQANGKNNGLIFIATTWRKSGIIQDVIVDGATVYNTQQWNGIRVSCTGSMSSPATEPIILRNSTANNTWGDGIVIYSCSNGLIEHTVAWDTGNIDHDDHGTPNSTWVWACKDCTIQYNEAYLAESPAVDGGAFDIDYPAVNNTVQYNYGHDNDSYCVAVLGAERAGTINSIVRYNICSNNCRETDSPDGSSSRFGEFDVFTWAGGWLDGVAIYNNTAYWNPWDGATWPAFCNGCIDGWPAAFSGTLPNFFMNNIIYSTSPNLVFSLDTMTLDNNIYWYTGTADPMFAYGGPDWSDAVHYTSFAAYQAGSGQDAHSYYTNPLMNDPTYHGDGMPTTAFTLQSNSPAINAGADLVTLGLQSSMGTRDFFGNGIPNGAYDIGAHEVGGAPPEPTDTPIPPTNTPVPPTNTPGGPTETPVPPTNTPAPPTNTPAPTSTSAPGNTLFFDDFEDGDMSDWTTSPSCAEIRTESYEGTYCAGAKLSGWFSHGVSTVGRSSIHLKYAGMTKDLDAGEYLLVEWYDGSSWSLVEQLLTANVYVLRDWALPAGAANNPNFAIRFTVVANKNTEWGFADIVEVTGQ